jgi:hypothetical protein
MPPVPVRRFCASSLGTTTCLILAVLSLGACRTRAALSSGEIGCRPSEIEISDATHDFLGGSTWTAECGGRRYYCSSNRGFGEHSVGTAHVSCTEDNQHAAPVAVKVVGPSGSTDREDSQVCEAAYVGVGDLSAYWSAKNPTTKHLDELPQQVDFVSVCQGLPDNVQRCLHSGYRAVHAKACDAVLLRLEPAAKTRVDGLFLEAETHGP